MTEPLPLVPPEPDGVLLHRRLLAGAATASSQLAVAYVDRLVDWLAAKDPCAPEHFRIEAAGEAVLSLIRNPAAYDPTRLGLFEYLCMAARGDLRNLLARERKHHRGRVAWGIVEDAAGGGNYLGRDEDPSLPLRLAEAAAMPQDPAWAEVYAAASPAERRVLDLMAAGERSTADFAAALGLAERTKEEQEREVKRLKDRLKQRLKRAGGEP
jgi:DNA-binding CsgD family transcriptional regulator